MAECIQRMFSVVVRVTYLLSMAEITSGSSFEPNKPREQKLHGVRLRVVESENDLEKKI